MGEWAKGRAIVLRAGRPLLRPTRTRPEPCPVSTRPGLVINLSAKVLETGSYGMGRKVTPWSMAVPKTVSDLHV